MKALGKQRTQRAIDQARGEHFLFGGAPLALEESPRDATGSIGTLLVIDGQRQKIHARRRFLAAHHSYQDHGIAHADQNGAGGLAGDAPSLQGDQVLAVLKSLYCNCHNASLPPVLV